MTNQFIRKFYAPGATGMSPVGIAASAIQTGLGIVQAISGSAKAKKFQQMIKAYETPDEVYDKLNATKNLASGGYDPFTLNFLTSQVDQSFAAGAGVLKRIGGDANQLSQLFGQRVQGMMKIGAENHALNMENFSKYLAALDTVAENKAAEQKSKQDIIKNQIAAAQAEREAGLQNIGGGINTAVSTYSAGRSNKLYTQSAKALGG